MWEGLHSSVDVQLNPRCSPWRSFQPSAYEIIWGFLSFARKVTLFATGLTHPAFIYKCRWHLSFTNELVFKKSCWLYRGPCRYLICAASWQAGRGLWNRDHGSFPYKHTRWPHHSLAHSHARILHVHRGKQVTDTHSGHLTWSSTLWATIVAASSCSASLRGRILKATCSTESEFSRPWIQSTQRYSIYWNYRLENELNSAWMGRNDTDSTEYSRV